MGIAPFSWSVRLYLQRQVPCDPYYPDTIDYPYVKHILSLQMIYHIVLMHYVGSDAIEVLPGSSLLTMSMRFHVTTSIVAMKSNFIDH